jgi:hypothetical protein
LGRPGRRFIFDCFTGLSYEEQRLKLSVQPPREAG